MTLFIIISVEGGARWTNGSEKAAIGFGEELNRYPEHVEEVRQWLDDYASGWGVYDEEDESEDEDTATGVAGVYQRLIGRVGLGELIHIDRIIYHE